MDSFRRISCSNLQTNSRGSGFQHRNEFCNQIYETDENEFPLPHSDLKITKKNALFSKNPSDYNKRILTKRDENPLPDSPPRSNLDITPQSNCKPFYDPITNYTSPRPKFLRYNPNQRRELLQRIEGEKRRDEEVSASINSDNEEEEEWEKGDEKSSFPYAVLTSLLLFGSLLFFLYGSSSSSESSADNFQRLPENLLRSFMSFTPMCPINEDSYLCSLEEIIGTEHKKEGDHDLLQRNVSLADNHSTITEMVEQQITQEQTDSVFLAPDVTATESDSESLPVSLPKNFSDTSFEIRTDKFQNASLISQATADAIENLKFPSSLLSVFLSSLSVIAGFLLLGFHKYVRKPLLKYVEKIPDVVLTKDEKLDAPLNSLQCSLGKINVEFKEALRVGPPTVQLLGEYSPFDTKGSNNSDFGFKMEKMEFSCSRKGRAKKMFSSYDKFDTSVESSSSRLSSREKLSKIEDFPKKYEVSDTSSSALRRSSRLQNRVASL